MGSQPKPTRGSQEVYSRFLEVLAKIVEGGENQYGMRLMTHNGRDALWDAFEESVDMSLYLLQAIMEKEDELKNQVNGGGWKAGVSEDRRTPQN